MGEFKKVFHAKRIFAMALAVVLTVTSAPVTAQAAPDENPGQELIETGADDSSVQGNTGVGGEETQRPSGDAAGTPADSAQTGDVQQMPEETEKKEGMTAGEDSEPESDEREGDSASEDSEPETGTQEGDSALEDSELDTGEQEETPDAGDVEEGAALGEAEEILPETVEESAVAKETQIQPLTSAADIASGSYTENGSDVSWVIDKDGKLTVTGTGDFAGSGRTSNQPKTPWYEYADQILSAEITVGGMTDASFMFYGCENLESVDVSGFKTGSITKMASMFDGCKSLTELNVSGFDTSNVTDMSHMFYWCTNLTELNISGFDTSNVTNMLYMFWGCSGLTELNISSFDTSSVTDMSYMFSARRLKKLDVSGFKTGNVTKMNSMFYGCSDLAELDVSGFDTSSVTDMSQMFLGCSSLPELDVSSFDTSSVADMSNMFYGCSSLTALNVCGFDTSNVTNMSGMFYDCRSLAKVDVSGFDTSSVTYMAAMFNGCSSLTAVNVSSFDTSKVTGMSSMFYGCSSLTALDVSGFDTSSVMDMNQMFRGCSNLTALNVGGFKTDNVTDMSSMFFACSSLAELNLSSFVTDSVTSMHSMLGGCESLRYLDLSCEMNIKDRNGEELGEEDEIYNFLDGTKPEIIYTPRNLKAKVILSSEDGDVWYDCKSKAYSELPRNLETSIVLTKNKTAQVSTIAAIKSRTIYRCGEPLNIDDLTVYYYDADGSVTRVTEGYTTNAAEIDMSVPGKKILKITYQNMSAEVEIEIKSIEETFFTVAFAGSGKDDIAAGTLKEVKEGENYTFTLTKAEGYIYTVTAVMGTQSVTPTADATGSIYTVSNVTANLVITINKTADQPQEPGKKICTVTFEGTGRDDVAVGTPKEVKEGENYTFTLTKAEGYTYTVTAVMGTQSVTPSVDTTGTLYTISGVTADLVITISRTADQTPDVPDLPEEDRTGLKIKFVHEEDAECVYTGKAVQPEIRVYYNGKILTPGTDYTVKYANNIKVGTATVTITGKGNFSKANSKTTFRILAKNMADSDLILSGVSKDADGKETVSFADAARLAPVLYYNNTKLSNKDFVVKNASDAEITNKKLTISDDNTVIRIEGKAGGNFTGSREFRLRIVDKKILKKFTVTVDKNRINTFSYDGRPHYIHETEGALTVTAKDEGKTVMEYGKDYAIVYQGDLVSAGTKKFTVVGMGLYTGSVSKSYTVKPAREETLTIRYDGSAVIGNKINGSFTFASAGVTIGDRLAIAGSDGKVLREGRDYKLAYSGNKKANQNAKCTVSFLGNYKGHAKVTVSYEIGKADLGGTDVVIADQLYKDKPGIYKSVPYVIEDRAGANTLLKASNYKVTYYTEDPANNAGAAQMKGANKIGDGATVWVKLEAKGNNYSGTKIVSYKVRSAQDLSKARITFQDAGGSAVKSAAYTGSQITGEQIKAVVNGTLAEHEKDIEVIYVDNIRKGKATVIVKAADTDGCKYVGSKKVTFSIVARNLN